MIVYDWFHVLQCKCSLLRSCFYWICYCKCGSLANVSLTGLKKYHLQAGSFMNRTRNQTQALKNSDPNFVKIAKYHLVETKDQIEYIYQEAVILQKVKTRIQIFWEKLDLLGYQSIYKVANMFGTSKVEQINTDFAHFKNCKTISR